MDLSVVFLGTGGSVPTARRATACVLLRAAATRVLVDCGEGAQRQMTLDRPGPGRRDLHHPLPRRPLPRPARAAQDLRPAWSREAPLRIDGPPGLHGLFDALRRIFGRISLRGRAGRARAGGGDRARRLRDARVRGRAPDDGARLRVVEAERPGPLRPRGRARRSASPTTATSARLQRGETIAVGRLRGPARAGDGRAPRRAQGRRHRRHRPLRDDAHRRPRRAAAGPRRRPSRSRSPRARPRPATRPPATPLSWPPMPRSRCWRSSTSPPATTSRRSSPRPATSSRTRSAPRDFDLVEIPFPERGEPGADPGRRPPATRAPGRAGAHRRVGNRRALRLRPSSGSERAATLARQAPLTRSREARKERSSERREGRARSRRSAADAGPYRPRDRREE